MCVCVCSGVGRFKKFSVNQVTFSTFWKPSPIICSRCTHTQARTRAAPRQPRAVEPPEPLAQQGEAAPAPATAPAEPAKPAQAGRRAADRARAAGAGDPRRSRGDEGRPLSHPMARAGARRCGGCRGAERRLPTPGGAPRPRGAACRARSGCSG